MLKLHINFSLRKRHPSTIMSSILVFMLALSPIITQGYVPREDQDQPARRGGRSGNVHTIDAGDFSPLLLQG